MLSRSALVLTLFTLLPARVLVAQATPDDSTSRDPAPCCGHDWRLPVAIAGTLAALALAPPALFLAPLSPDTSQAIPDYVTVYFFNGVSGRHTDSTVWSHNENVEILRRRLLISARVESFEYAAPVRFVTIRGGYMVGRKGPLGAAVVLGYRHASGRGTRDGAELSLPFMMENDRAALRFEPSYIVSSAGFTFNYRCQVEAYLWRHWVLGLAFEAKPLRQAERRVAGVTLLVGYRH
jgi:hypothetical protein